MLTALRLFIARLRALVGGAAQDREFAQELESHLEMLTDDNIRRGMTPEAAARQARITVGAASSLQSRHRDVRGFRLLEDFFQDLRFATRLMREGTVVLGGGHPGDCPRHWRQHHGLQHHQRGLHSRFQLRAGRRAPQHLLAPDARTPNAVVGARSRGLAIAIAIVCLDRRVRHPAPSISATTTPRPSRRRDRGSPRISSTSLASGPFSDARSSRARIGARRIPSSSSAMTSGPTASGAIRT